MAVCSYIPPRYYHLLLKGSPTAYSSSPPITSATATTMNLNVAPALHADAQRYFAAGPSSPPPPFWGNPADWGAVDPEQSDQDIFSELNPADVDPALDWQSEYVRVRDAGNWATDERLKSDNDDELPPTAGVTPESQPVQLDCTTPPRAIITVVREPPRPTPPRRREPQYTSSPVDSEAADAIGVVNTGGRFRMIAARPDYAAVYARYSTVWKDRAARYGKAERKGALHHVIRIAEKSVSRPAGVQPLSVFDSTVRLLAGSPEGLQRMIDLTPEKHPATVDILGLVLKLWKVEDAMQREQLVEATQRRSS